MGHHMKQGSVTKKKVFVLVVGAIFAFLAILWVKGNTMREIKTEIEISAPPAKVWSVLTEIDKWKDWSPIINDASGKAALGAKLSITMCGKDGKEGKGGPKYQPIVTVFEAPKRFEWMATMMAGFIFTNGKIIELEQSGSGTRLVHKETFSGIMVPLMWGQMEGSVPQMLNSMNEALKKLVEKGSGL